MKSSRYAPTQAPVRGTRSFGKSDYDPKAETRRMWESRVGKPPRPEDVTPALRELRRRWYAQNPWSPDWQANWEALRGARACFLERGTA